MQTLALMLAAAQAHKPILRTMTDAPPHTLRAAPVHSPHFPKPLFFETRRDHFNITDTTKWQQAYYVNATFWTPGSGAPVFLCVGGEGPALDGSVVVSSVHCNNAVEWLSETRALMFAVEHRYYGCHNMSACPYSPSDEKPLRWLSSRQALADLATFQRHATSAFGISAASKWVTFGGSYPGMLASFARIKHPPLHYSPTRNNDGFNHGCDCCC